jgi:hypothetical protein
MEDLNPADYKSRCTRHWLQLHERRKERGRKREIRNRIRRKEDGGGGENDEEEAGVEGRRSR